jgi:folate-binding protein YgfZ
MTSVPDFLAARGARADADGIADFGNPSGEWAAATTGAVVADASSLGVLVVAGADAAAFLHGQLSSDVKRLARGEGVWTSYNSPKGRMLATAFICRPDVGPEDRFEALVAADLAEAVRKRLAMFVLRSKVAIANDTATWLRLGVGGPGAADAVAKAFGQAPPAGGAVTHDGARIVRLPDGRFVVLVPVAGASTVFDGLAREAVPAGAPVWTWLGIRSGVPMVTAATQDRFVAQTANWDAIGGLDFHKGCYPGQEIVARTQYLGRLKERLFAYATASSPPAPGSRLFGPPYGDQPCGTVVNAAPDPGGGARFLAVVQVDAAGGPLALGAPDGPPATQEPLPYAIPPPGEARGRVRL